MGKENALSMTRHVLTKSYTSPLSLHVVCGVGGGHHVWNLSSLLSSESRHRWGSFVYTGQYKGKMQDVKGDLQPHRDLGYTQIDRQTGRVYQRGNKRCGDGRRIDLEAMGNKRDQ